jgi:squalene-hopene/tetraprenyl-beta-curcumene cyclase
MSRFFAACVFTALLAAGPVTGQDAEVADFGPNTAEEPLARKVSIAKAAGFLDSVAVEWTRKRKCGTCHTNFAYLWARPSLSAFQSPAMGEIRGFFEKRAEAWEKEKPKEQKRMIVWETQIIAIAVSLAVNDAQTTRKLHPMTRKAFEKTWALQKPDGSWNWPKCSWPPMEHDDYFGATYVAIGVGMAPEGYARSDEGRAGLDKIRGYLKAHPAPDLHHELMLLWASTKVDGLMSPEARDAAVRKLLAAQKEDGGWTLNSMGDYTRHDGTVNAQDAPSDGYATGLTVYVLRLAGIPAERAELARGVAWLKSHQRESGRWFTRSPSTDNHHFLTHTGTAYAVMALAECGEAKE